MFKKLLQSISDFRGENQNEMSMNERDTVTHEVMEGLYWSLDNRSHVATITSIVFDDNGHDAKVILSNGAVSYIDYVNPLEFVNGLIRAIEGAGK